MKTHILRALSEKSFFNLWMGEIFTQVAINLFNFFLILVVFEKTHSNTAVSGVVVAFTVPAILLGSLAGVLVDRWNKKQVLIIANVSRALLFVILAFYLNNLILIYILAFIVSALAQFFIPAESPIIPLVVSNKNLLSANALFGLGVFGSILVAYVFSGPLLLLAGPMNTLFVLALMLCIGAAFIFFVRLTYAKVATEFVLQKSLNIIKDIRDTLELVSKTKGVSSSFFLLSLSQVLTLVFATIAPGYAHQVLGIAVEELPLVIIAPASLGIAIGAIIIVNIFHSHPKEKIITAGIFISGFAILLLPYGSRVASRDFVHTLNIYLPHIFDITILHIMAFISFILGVANALVFVPANTILQERTADAFRGKIYGMLNSITGVFSLLPIIVVGGLSDLIGVSNVITGIAIAIILFGFTRFKKFRISL